MGTDCDSIAATELEPKLPAEDVGELTDAATLPSATEVDTGAAMAYGRGATFSPLNSVEPLFGTFPNTSTFSGDPDWRKND